MLSKLSAIHWWSKHSHYYGIICDNKIQMLEYLLYSRPFALLLPLSITWLPFTLKIVFSHLKLIKWKLRSYAWLISHPGNYYHCITFPLNTKKSIRYSSPFFFFMEFYHDLSKELHHWFCIECDSTLYNCCITSLSENLGFLLLLYFLNIT